MGKDKVAEDVAEAEFQRFADAMHLDVDESEMDAADKKAFKTRKRRIVLAMRSGALVIDEKGRPVFTIGNGEQVTFPKPRVNQLISAQSAEGANVAQTVALLAEMTEVPPTTFHKMDMHTFNVCSAIVDLFLG